MSGKAVRRGMPGGRGRILLGVLVGALALVPVAVAWACNPQAHLSLDRSTYSPGQGMTVYGSYFPGNSTITVSGPAGSQTVTASSAGAFTVTMTAPSQEGQGYTVTASRPTGGFAAASFSVAAPVQPQPAAPSSPPQEEAPAPAQSQSPPASSPGTAVQREVRTPSVNRSQRTTAPAGRGDSGGGGSPATGQTPAAGTAPVFSGSVAPATGGSFATAAPTTPVAESVAGGSRRDAGRERAGGDRSVAAPSQQTALSDVWSTFEPGRTPSLTAASGAPSGGTGSQLAWGIGLLGIGVFALVGGLAYTEARRRRPV